MVWNKDRSFICQSVQTNLNGTFLHAQEPILHLVWKRYIDDILCIWTGARSELDKLNKAHRTPIFTWSISDLLSDKHIEFLE